MTLTVRLPVNLENRLAQLAKKTKRSKSSFVRDALKEYLGTQQNYYESLKISQRMKQNKEKSYTLEEVIKTLGIEEDL
jgi:RHH-type rel operon transcriptional repressor/antitoxin RelB